MLYGKNKCQIKLGSCVASRTRMELHQNFIQWLVGNELQIPEKGEIAFFSRHTALSSINIHLIAVITTYLMVTLGPLAHVWDFSIDFNVKSVL